MSDPSADLLNPAAAARCPACAAALRPGAPWCTLCYADLRPAEPLPAPASDPVVVPPEYAPVALDPLTAPAETLGLPAPTPVAVPEARWPCAACEASNAYTLSVCAACGTAFLAGVRESEPPLLVLPGVGDVAVLSRAQRLGLAAGVVLAVAAFTAVLGLLFS